MISTGTIARTVAPRAVHIHGKPHCRPPRGGKSDTARSGSTTPAVRAIASLFGLAHPDSGCTGRITPDEKSLINRRPCSDTFRAANKKLAKATCIGDLPAVVVRKDGVPVFVTFENVRCVPDFDYTLLSVNQLWREQKINSLFADDQCLVLKNGDRLPYHLGTELPTVRIISVRKLLAITCKRGGAALPAVATPATAIRPPPTPSTTASSSSRPSLTPAAPPIAPALTPAASPPTQLTSPAPSPPLAPVPPAAAATPIQLTSVPIRLPGIPRPEISRARALMRNSIRMTANAAVSACSPCSPISGQSATPRCSML